MKRVAVGDLMCVRGAVRPQGAGWTKMADVDAWWRVAHQAENVPDEIEVLVHDERLIRQISANFRPGDYSIVEPLDIPELCEERPHLS